MYVVETGVDEQGRSVVVRHEQVNVHLADMGHGFARIWSSPVLPPPLPYARPASIAGEEIDLHVPHGGAAASMATMPPGYRAPTHRTDTYDVALISAGSADLILEAGRVSVSTGDWVVMPGIVHGWEAGPDGCTIVGWAVGIGRPEGVP